MERPSENIQATVGTVVGAVVAILAGYHVDIPQGVVGGAIILVSYVAWAVTLYVRAKQKAGELLSDTIGRVVKR